VTSKALREYAEALRKEAAQRKMTRREKCAQIVSAAGALALLKMQLKGRNA
jgi:hypothetical protein